MSHEVPISLICSKIRNCRDNHLENILRNNRYFMTYISIFIRRCPKCQTMSTVLYLSVTFYFVTVCNSVSWLPIWISLLRRGDEIIVTRTYITKIISSIVQPHLIGWIMRKELARDPARIFRYLRRSSGRRCRRCMIIYEMLVRDWFACLVSGGFARGYRTDISGTWAQHPQ